MTESEKIGLIYEVGRTFTPSSPIEVKTLFAGRQKEITRLVNAVAQKGQHAVLYGERGVGKTSLANVLRDFLEGKGEYVVVNTNCDAGASFKSIWANIFSQMHLEIEEVGMGIRPPTHILKVEVSVSENPNPEEIRLLIEKTGKSCVFIIDELDRIAKPEVSMAIADTIKTLSDHGTDATLILVGVADDVDSLLKGHKSVERALVEIPMPRMSPSELAEIVNKGLKDLDMTITGGALHRIANLSHGLPHYTHALALHGAQSAINRLSKEIAEDDVSAAIKATLSTAERSVISDYQEAINSPRGNLYGEVLLACAMAQTDEFGFFRPIDVEWPMSKIMGRTYKIAAFSQHLNAFCVQNRGPVLQKSGWRKRFKFRFLKPLMEPYILMRGLSKGQINMDDLDERFSQRQTAPTEPRPLF